MTVSSPEDARNSKVLKFRTAKMYKRDSDGTLVALRNQNPNGGFNGIILLGTIFALTTVLLLLTYFILFLYNRLRHPDTDLDDNEAIVAGDGVKSTVRSEGQNLLILTKEDLQARVFQPDTKERAKSDKVAETGGGESERQGSKVKMEEGRDVTSEEHSEGSMKSNESGKLKCDLPSKEETDEGSDQLNSPPSDVMPSRDPPANGVAGSKLSQEETNEMYKKMKVQQFGSDYWQYVKREWRTGNEQLSHHIDYSNAMLKK